MFSAISIAKTIYKIFAYDKTINTEKQKVLLLNQKQKNLFKLFEL